MHPQTIEVLSAGAVEPGLVAAADAFNRHNDDRVRLAWATTPTIRKRVAAGEVFDLLVVPDAALADFARERRVVADEHVPLGRVGVGVAVRAAEAAPDVSEVAAFEQALANAESIVFTLATSGIYVETLLRRMDLYERLLPRITRFATGPQMMEHLIHGRGREICLGAIVELLMFRDRGVRFAGALPHALEHFTAYVAVPMSSASHPQGARNFMQYLMRAESRAMFAACGVDVG